MRIRELTAWHTRLRLRKPIQHASHTRTETDNVVIRCVLENGVVGFGEGVPREYVTGETIDTAFDLLAKSDLKSQFVECRDFSAAVAMAERMRLLAVPGDDRQCQGNAARCAVELAVLDAFGRGFGTPLSECVRLLAPELYNPLPKLQYSGAITNPVGRKLRITCWKYWVFGFRQMKVKVGIEGQDDVDRLKSIRKLLGKKVDLRIDANEAWNIENAADRILELEPFGITSVEQPVPHEQSRLLADIRDRIHTPIMHDESLCSMVDAERSIADRSCDLFNIRISKCGGFLPSLRLAQKAKKHGLGYQLGCQVGESAILSAAGRHFASSVRDIRYLEGSYDRHLVTDALGKRDITFGWSGWAPAFRTPGLGVEIDEAALERVACRKEVLFA